MHEDGNQSCSTEDIELRLKKLFLGSESSGEVLYKFTQFYEAVVDVVAAEKFSLIKIGASVSFAIKYISYVE